MDEYVVLVNEEDTPTGTMEKMEAHKKGALHRAFSIFIFNSKGELLLQQRALDKYHSPGLWTNTCCSHPRHGEAVLDAAHRRLAEEMGMQCSLEYHFKFLYKAQFENGLIEHELDHVFFGNSDALPELNPAEVAAYRYIGMDLLEKELNEAPEKYSPWLRISFDQVKGLSGSYKAAGEQ
jgi:isopentenyl-diphosphate delta-isomerase